VLIRSQHGELLTGALSAAAHEMGSFVAVTVARHHRMHPVKDDKTPATRICHRADTTALQLVARSSSERCLDTIGDPRPRTHGGRHDPM
jgi:hypothetical protein